MFGLILKFGNLALVTMVCVPCPLFDRHRSHASQDTAFWQKSFASEVQSTVPGYDLAALAIFAVPWGLGTVFGLSARVIEKLPVSPTYPQGFTAAEVASGFVMPYTIKALLGSGPTVGMLLLLFMAATSTVSSSMIAVSSIISFDIYRTYINPKATDKQVVNVSHLGVVFHGIFISGFALMLSYGGANISWVNYFSPILTCPGIFPLIFTLMWSRQSKPAAIVAPILGLISGVSVWLATAKSIYGGISFATTVELASSLYGSIASLFSPILYSVIISYFTPERFDWREFLRIDLVQDESTLSVSDLSSPDESVGAYSTPNDKEQEKTSLGVDAVERPLENSAADGPATPATELVHPLDEKSLQDLRRWYKIAWIFLIVIVALTFVVWPMPLYRDYIFTKPFFSGWVTVSIFWQFFALFAVVVYSVLDGRHEIAKSVQGLRKSLGNRLGGKNR